jgi:hypothetical protein
MTFKYLLVYDGSIKMIITATDNFRRQNDHYY